MSILGGEKMSRLGVGIFALVLIGGLVAFFTGSLDSVLGSNNKTAGKSPAAAPSATVTQTAPSKAAVVNSAKVAAAAPANIPASPPVQVTAPATTKPQTLATVADTAIAKTAQPPASTTDVVRAKSTPIPKQARSHDLDLRSCLDLGSDIEIAHCAYKLP